MPADISHFTSGLELESSKPILRLTPNLALDGEESTRQPFARRCLRRRCGHVQSLQLRTAKSTGRNVVHRHLDHTVDLSIWRDANNTTAAIAAVPQIAFSVDGRAVRQAAFEILKKWDSICQGAGDRIEVVGPNDVRQAVSKIKAFAIRAPRQRVGDANVLTMHGNATVRIHAMKN